MTTSTSGSDGRTYLSLVQSCDNLPYDITPSEVYYLLFLPDDPQPHGYMLPETVQKMPWTSRFRVDHAPPGRSVTVLDASAGADTAGAVNAAFAELVDRCVDRRLFHVLAGQHSEPFAVVSARYAAPVRVERFAAALFGVTSRGAYITAYTKTPTDTTTTTTTTTNAGDDSGNGNGNNEIKLWIARRAAHLYTGPGMLDATVAGGIRADSTPLETIIHEADEEASLPEALVRERVQPAGVLTYITATGADFPGEKGLIIPDIIYVHDLELPSDVVPRPNDDEVETFYLMGVEEVQRALLNGEFKPDSAAVLIDFFMRRGVITAQNERDYVELSMRLHRRLPFRTP